MVLGKVRSYARISVRSLDYFFSKEFWAVIFDPRAKFSLGTFARHNGDSLPYLFRFESIPISNLRVGGVSLESSLQFKRVQDVITGACPGGSESFHLGRAVGRVEDLLSARQLGNDDFVICLRWVSRDEYWIVDGATRAAILLITGETDVRAVVTLWS